MRQLDMIRLTPSSATQFSGPDDLEADRFSCVRLQGFVAGRSRRAKGSPGARGHESAGALPSRNARTPQLIQQ